MSNSLENQEIVKKPVDINAMRCDTCSNISYLTFNLVKETMRTNKEILKVKYEDIYQKKKLPPAVVHTIIKTQKNFRRYIVKKRYRRFQQFKFPLIRRKNVPFNEISSPKFLKKYRKIFALIENQIVKFQAIRRGYITRIQFQLIKKSIIKLQAIWRNELEMRKLEEKFCKELKSLDEFFLKENDSTSANFVDYTIESPLEKLYTNTDNLPA